MSTKNRTRQNKLTRNIRFPNQMIEQINIALEQKGPGISQPGSLKLTSETNEKRAYTSIKSDEEWTSRVLPSEHQSQINLITRALQ